MDLGLRGRRALVSGATQGIGRAVTDALAAEGTDLFLVARDAERLALTAKQVRAEFGVRCDWHSADFSVPGEAGAAAEVCGPVDVVVNNAGRSHPATLETEAGEWAASQQLNFLSHLEVIRTVLPGMRERGWGRIVNVTGAAYRAPLQLNSGTIAKYGLVNAAKNLAREVAQSGVTVNTVTVGFIDSHQMGSIHYAEAEHRQQIVDRLIPMGRFGLPREVAAAAAFLASDRASYVTGSTVTVDGGADPTLL
ncbi:SDR family NAD(P)-dependent oxidoreductase [Pseudonocardia pini]|uniref:SDR family NAD(P)-dependent oxidoreductase n=1 Tax=Pseudonocardia pini TaxID=2758030 RepID=UPI0015F09CE5|nr:SDR family oxidoreductase [Pseudonocardia pini]